MTRLTRPLGIALLASAVLLFTSLPSAAHEGRQWRQDHRGAGPAWSQHRTGSPPQVIRAHQSRQRVQVHHHYYYPAPVAGSHHAPPRYAPPRHRHERPPAISHYPPFKHPAIIISVPPIVIPMR